MAATIPKPTGPFPVGCCDVMTKAKSLPVDFQPSWLCAQYTDLGSYMTLYYPAETELDVTQYDRASWIPDLHTSWYCNGLSVNNLRTSWFSFVVKYYQKGVTQHAFLNAPLIDAQSMKEHALDNVIKQSDKLPVVIFSHGLSACRTFYSSFCTELASRGFVVASIEHRDGSSCSSFFIDSDGTHTEVPYFYTDITDDGDEIKFLLRNMQLLKRSKEISKLMDLLQDLNESPNIIENVLDIKPDLAPFKNRLDLSNTILMGHSFGAATCLDALHKDKRLKCGVLLDLWTVPLGPDLYCKMRNERPLLVIMTECWKWKKNCDRLKMYTNHQKEGSIETVTLKNAGHVDQTDATPIIPRTLSWVFGKDLGPIDFEHGINVQRKLIMEYCTKFLAMSVSGNSNLSSVNLLSDEYDLHKDFSIGYSM